MSPLRIVVAALLAAAAFATPASARCAEAFTAVCSAYRTACAEIRDADPTGRLCAVRP